MEGEDDLHLRGWGGVWVLHGDTCDRGGGKQRSLRDFCSQGRTCSLTHDIARDIWGTPQPQANNILFCFSGLNVFSGRAGAGAGGGGGGHQGPPGRNAILPYSSVAQVHGWKGNTISGRASERGFRMRADASKHSRRTTGDLVSARAL